MQIRHVRVRHFRGIETLDWTVGCAVVCLIGPGDATKSTVLDAIDLALSSRWKIDFDDSDFYNGDTSKDIEITVTVGGLPDTFKADGRFGLDLRGWSEASDIHDEPEDGDELVLSVRLTVGAALEPHWCAINDRRPEGRPISSQDRESLGVARIGSLLDRHLTWTRGSVLSRITGKADDLGGILAEASRAARQTLKPGSLPLLQAAADRAAKLARTVGVVPKVSYSPHLDIQAVDVHAGGLTLHDGEVPLRRAGLGTRRLLTLALQRETMNEGGIALIDEIEHGLEPHRLRRLLRALHGDSTSLKSKDAAVGQMIATTHSEVVLDGLCCEELRIVRSRKGDTQIFSIPTEFQKEIWKAPEAFLGSALLICEGETEVGFCRALDSWWAKSPKYDPFAVRGIVPIDGGGNDAPRLAVCFSRLGYPIAYLGDSDCPLKPDRAAMEKVGITVVLWDGNMSLEERVAADLPWTGVQEVVRLAGEIRDENKIRAAVIGKYSSSSKLIGDPESWPDSAELRKAIGLAAKGGAWFKRIDFGESLGQIIAGHLSKIPNTDLAKKVAAVRKWIDDHE